MSGGGGDDEYGECDGVNGTEKQGYGDCDIRSRTSYSSEFASMEDKGWDHPFERLIRYLWKYESQRARCEYVQDSTSLRV